MTPVAVGVVHGSAARARPIVGLAGHRHHRRPRYYAGVAGGAGHDTMQHAPAPIAVDLLLPAPG